MMTFKELKDYIYNFEGSERELNVAILTMFKEEKLSLNALLEYLEVTQGDIFECIEESWVKELPFG